MNPTHIAANELCPMEISRSRLRTSWLILRSSDTERGLELSRHSYPCWSHHQLESAIKRFVHVDPSLIPKVHGELKGVLHAHSRLLRLKALITTAIVRGDMQRLIEGGCSIATNPLGL